MSAPLDEGQRALQFMLEKSASRTDLLKKGLLLVAGIFGVGFAVWYFVLRGSSMDGGGPPPSGGLPGETTPPVPPSHVLRPGTPTPAPVPAPTAPTAEERRLLGGY